MFFSKEEFGGGGRVDSIYALWPPSAAYTTGVFSCMCLRDGALHSVL